MLGTQFSQNLLADERGWFMELAEADLEGLPGFVVDTARAAGAERGLGPVVTLNRSLIVPFLQFSPRRALRQKAYEAWVARGANGGATDNRGDRGGNAGLAGRAGGAVGVCRFRGVQAGAGDGEDAGRGARSADAGVGSLPAAMANADAAVLEAMLRADGIKGPLEAWDWRYYSEKRRRAEHDLDEAALKPYLSPWTPCWGRCSIARHRLFGLEFREIDGPFYHPDVRGWEVTPQGRACRGVPGRLLRARVQTVGRLVFGDARRSASWAAMCGPSW